MIHSAQSSYLDDAIRLLVQHFGPTQVQAALVRAKTGRAEEPQKRPRDSVHGEQRPKRPTVAKALELIHGNDPERYHLLSEFFSQLKNRTILAESQDIRHFAQLIGLKSVTGRSRNEMIPTLMRFLLDQPIERLRTDLKKADNVSEQQRQQGFSVLTDKLIGGR